MYLRVIYIFPESFCLFGYSEIGIPILGIYNLSQIPECENLETEHYNSILEITSPTVSFLGIHNRHLYRILTGPSFLYQSGKRNIGYFSVHIQPSILLVCSWINRTLALLVIRLVSVLSVIVKVLFFTVQCLWTCPIKAFSAFDG
jgi:hypothetical protein